MALFGFEPTILVIEISKAVRALDHTAKVTGRIVSWDHNFLNLVSKFKASGVVSPLPNRSSCRGAHIRTGGNFTVTFPFCFAYVSVGKSQVPEI
jgi:hypothetical protein